MEEEQVELDFEKNPVLSLSECLDYLETKCNYRGIRERFKEYVDVDIDSEMYDMYGIFYHHFGVMVEDSKRMHDESIFRNIFDIQESGTYFTA